MKIFKSKNADLAQVCFLARKHGLIQFDGSCLDLPDDKFLTIFLIKPITKIRKILGSIDPKDSFYEEVEERSEWYNKYINDDQERIELGRMSPGNENENPIENRSAYRNLLDGERPGNTLSCSPSQRLQILITCKQENNEKFEHANLTPNIKDDKYVCHKCRENERFPNQEYVSSKPESDEYFNPSCHGVQVFITCKKDELDEQQYLDHEYGCTCDQKKFHLATKSSKNLK